MILQSHGLKLKKKNYNKRIDEKDSLNQEESRKELPKLAKR
jgi:hypothetical protein